jgi:hypothetical protein
MPKPRKPTKRIGVHSRPKKLFLKNVKRVERVIDRSIEHLFLELCLATREDQLGDWSQITAHANWMATAPRNAWDWVFDLHRQAQRLAPQDRAKFWRNIAAYAEWEVGGPRGNFKHVR